MCCLGGRNTLPLFEKRMQLTRKLTWSSAVRPGAILGVKAETRLERILWKTGVRNVAERLGYLKLV